MSIRILGTDGDTLHVQVSARLTEPELASLQQAAADIIRQRGSLRVLVQAESFAGWERGGLWNDFSFQEENDRHIRRMAIVGEPRWKDEVLLFVSKGLRQFPIEYFPPEQLAEARTWLAAGR